MERWLKKYNSAGQQIMRSKLVPSRLVIAIETGESGRTMREWRRRGHVRTYRSMVGVTLFVPLVRSERGGAEAGICSVLRAAGVEWVQR